MQKRVMSTRALEAGRSNLKGLWDSINALPPDERARVLSERAKKIAETKRQKALIAAGEAPAEPKPKPKPKAGPAYKIDPNFQCVICGYRGRRHQGHGLDTSCYSLYFKRRTRMGLEPLIPGQASTEDIVDYFLQVMKMPYKKTKFQSPLMQMYNAGATREELIAAMDSGYAKFYEGAAKKPTEEPHEELPEEATTDIEVLKKTFVPQTGDVKMEYKPRAATPVTKRELITQAITPRDLFYAHACWLSEQAGVPIPSALAMDGDAARTLDKYDPRFRVESPSLNPQHPTWYLELLSMGAFGHVHPLCERLEMIIRKKQLEKELQQLDARLYEMTSQYLEDIQKKQEEG